MTLEQKPIVLLTDDDPIVRKMILFSLRNIPAQFQQAACGGDAITLLESHAPKIMILDYDLGDMNASEFLQAVLAKGLKLPKIILLTSYDQEFISGQDLDKALAHVISKPFSPNELQKLVRDLLQ